MASMQKRTFSFYRCFCRKTCSQKLEIPISEMDTMQRDSLRRSLPDKVLLRNSAKRIWSMAITDTGNALFFQNGWEKFVKDNSIENGENLVFDYDGSGLFDFLLFNKSQCEKVAIAYTKTRVKKEDEMDGTGKGDEEEEVEVTHAKGKRHKTCGSKRGVGVGAGAGEGSSSGKIRDVSDHFGADLFRSGRYAQPANPYFVAKIIETKRGELYVPMEVIKNISLPPTLIMRDPRGKEWRAKIMVWGDGRTWVSGGWRSLCRWNLVQKDDRCVCEFLPSEGKDMVMQVTILRDVSKEIAQ